MCLIVLAVAVAPGRPLVVAANRDEFHRRPAASAHLWPGRRPLLAGRDLEAGGTWLGATAGGRFAAITNVRERESGAADGHRSRGELVVDFLAGSQSATAAAAALDGARYRGFNLLLYDGAALVYCSNRGPVRPLAPGIYSIANAGLDERRFKTRRAAAGLAAAVAEEADAGALQSRLLDLLADRALPPSPESSPQRTLPSAALDACFIVGEHYGTRASTALLLDEQSVQLAERSYGPGGALRGESWHRLPRAAAASG